jgi:hypothetical protein
MRHDSDHVKRFVTVNGVRRLLEIAEDPSDAGVSGKHFGVAVMNDLTEAIGANCIEGRVFEELITTTNKGTCAAICEELSLKRICRDDSDRGGPREMVEELFEFTKLEFGSILHPRLLHQAIVFLSR